MDKEKFLKYLEQEEISIDVENFNIDNTFSDNGIDSLDIFAILLRIEDDLGVKVPDSELDGINTIKELIEHVNKKIN